MDTLTLHSLRNSPLPIAICLVFLLLAGFENVAGQESTTPSLEPTGVNSQSPPPEDHCKDFKAKKNIDNFIQCVQQINDRLSWHGVKPAFGGIVPGSGFGGGVKYEFLDRKEKDDGGVSVVWQRKFEAEAKVTFRKYWQLAAALNMTRTRSSFGSHTLEMNFYGQTRDLTRLDFYGLGPESSHDDLAKYHYRESVIGADVSRGVASWLDLGAAVEGNWPRLTTISDPTVRSVDQLYNDQTAPGLLADPSYVRFTGYVGLHESAEPERRRVAYDFFYNIYKDVSDSQLSFRRFDADLKHKFRLGEKAEIRLRGRLSSADTSPGQRVPFYLQETLGGGNLRNEDTLRGFDDYRFRDQAFALVQADFMVQLYGPLKLIVFYDTGKVAPSFRRLDEGRLRHTYGTGIVIIPRQLDKILFRFYVALGSGEGSHTFFGLGDSIMGGSSKLVR